VRWHSASLTEVPPILPRKAVVGVVNCNPETWKTFEKYIEVTNDFCAKAAENKADILVMTEMMNLYSSANMDDLAEEIPNGPTCKITSENAKRYNMYICNSIVEKRNDNLYNTAVLYDRNGELIGKYSKVHLYFPEEMDSGTVPGDEHPVFDLDFGRIGIVICYDNWFPESYRILALKGAELVLFPNAGYELKTLPARGIDNGIYIACSSMHHQSSVVNSLGNEILKLQTPYGENSVETIEIDLSQRPLPHANAGGIMNGSPGGKRIMRHSRSLKLYEEILEEISKLENYPSVYTWL
jgi:predicted amidohydrolase